MAKRKITRDAGKIKTTDSTEQGHLGAITTPVGIINKIIEKDFDDLTKVDKKRLGSIGMFVGLCLDAAGKNGKVSKSKTNKILKDITKEFNIEWWAVMSFWNGLHTFNQKRNKKFQNMFRELNEEMHLGEIVK